LLHRIHECGFNAIEHDRAEHYRHQHEAEAVQQPQRLYCARAEEAVTERLNQRGDGVDPDQPKKALGHGGCRVDHRGGVHQQRNAEPHQEAQVAVLGCHRRNENAQPKPEPGHDEQQQREGEDPQVGADLSALQREISHEQQEEDKLHGERNQVGNEDGDRHGEAREVHLAEQVAVGYESVGGLSQAVCEVAPQHSA